MTWCSVDKATPRFDLASSAIRCRFVDRFVRLKVLSRVARQRFSPRGAPLPSIGSRRVQFPDVISTMKALRLPHTHPRSLIGFASRAHASPPCFVLAATSAPRQLEVLPRARVIVQPATQFAGAPSRGRERDLSDCMSLSTNEATHPRCSVEGCPDRPGRASYMEGES